jgi:hypothetical protein
MKKILILSVVSILFFAFVGPKAAIEWSFTEYDFGSIEKNKPATIEFIFKNPGMIPLVVTDVKSSCGCTVPKYPKEPIAPQQEGKILVTYDAKVSGYFSKTVTVHTNTSEGKSLLYIKGEVN